MVQAPMDMLQLVQTQLDLAVAMACMRLSCKLNATYTRLAVVQSLSCQDFSLDTCSTAAVQYGGHGELVEHGFRHCHPFLGQLTQTGFGGVLHWRNSCVRMAL